jgi:uncharacterized protein with von Willebrand factor type A (vWA) domain
MLLDLLRAARGAGVRVSPAESLDAMRAAEAVGYADRTALRDALTLSIAKSVEEKRAFEACFDLFFQREMITAGAPPAGGQAPGPAAAPAEGADDFGTLSAMLLADDRAGLAAAMEGAAEAVGASGISLFTQTNMFAWRILERMGLAELDRDIARLRGEAGDPDAAERLEAARAALGAQARAYMERQLALFAAGTAREIREDALRAARLSQLDRRDLDRMRVLVRDMARTIATRYSRKRWKARRGHLDPRRTIRRNMSHDGIPFRTVWKRTRIDKPTVMTLCDVSGSVAAVARFLLMFLYALADALASIRSFAFSNHLVEVSDVLARREIDDAIEEVMKTVGFGASDYGRSLADFAEIAMGDIDRQTTVIILGDGRGNRNEPRIDLLKQIFERGHRVIWLNPEPPALWGTGDSDILRYRPFCHQVTPCGTLAELERVIADMMRLAQ